MERVRKLARPPGYRISIMSDPCLQFLHVITLNDVLYVVHWLRPWPTTMLCFKKHRGLTSQYLYSLSIILHYVGLHSRETSRCLWHLPPWGVNGLAQPVNNEVGLSIVNHRGVFFGWRLWEKCMGMACVRNEIKRAAITWSNVAFFSVCVMLDLNIKRELGRCDIS